MMTRKEKIAKFLDMAVIVTGCLMAFYHLLITQYRFQGALEDYNLHLGFALVLVFLHSLKNLKRSWTWPIVVLLMICSLVVTTYIKVRYTHLEAVVGLPEFWDIVIGVILIVVVIEGTRQAWGAILPLISGLFIAYFFFGQHIPWTHLAHGGFDFDYIVSVLGIGFKGIFGDFLGVSANYIFLFLVFGGLMEVIGVPGLLLEIGKAAGRVLQGGAAHTAVIGSSIIGTVSGAAVANVTLTGSFTIPLMKKSGYHPNMAGAIEATASTGGQLMPPIMGAAAFIIAYNLGVSYLEVMVAALIPALFYYFSVFIAVEIIARKNNIIPSRQDIDVKLIFHRLPVFMVPLAIIVVLLILRFSPMYAAFYAIIAALVLSYARKETRPTLSKLARGISSGAMAGAQIAIVLACVGVIAQTLYTTGSGVKLTGLVEELTAGHLFPALMLTMVISIILGCGLPTAGAYVLVALTVAPVLTRMNVLPMAAHFFAFYFAIISALTPPVALAALAGASIARGDYWKTSIDAFKLAVAGFTIPFFAVYNPAFLLSGGGVIKGILSIAVATMAMILLVALIYNYLFVKISYSEKIGMLICVSSGFGYIFGGWMILALVTSAAFVMVMMMQLKRRKALL